MPTSADSGPLAAALEVLDDDNVMLVSSSGEMTPVAAADIPLCARNAAGEEVVGLAPGDRLATVTRLHGDPGLGSAADQLDLLGPGRRS
jgi:DNA gyrase/topoisomerase IV subunit A